MCALRQKRWIALLLSNVKYVFNAYVSNMYLICKRTQVSNKMNTILLVRKVMIIQLLSWVCSHLNKKNNYTMLK